MKYINQMLLAGLLLLGACSKKISVDATTFNVTVLNNRSTNGDTLIFNLKDTVKYGFSGYAGNVVLYNGTVGQCYDNRNRTSAAGTPVLIFNTTATLGTQTNTLQLLATNKLAGYDSTSIVSAAWTDITSRAPLSVGSGAVGPDTVKLADLSADSLIIAFKYTGVTGSIQRTWSITNYNVLNMIPAAPLLPALNYSLSNLAVDAGFFKTVKVAPAASPTWVTSTSSLTLTGGAATNANNTSWIVSKPLYLNRVSPDLPSQAVQNVNSATQFGPFIPATPLPYSLTVANTYKVTFVYFNDNIDNSSGTTKTFYIRFQ